MASSGYAHQNDGDDRGTHHEQTVPQRMRRIFPGCVFTLRRQRNEAKCRGGDADACAALARLYRDGYHGFSRDTEKADELSSLARKYRSARQDAGDD